MIKVHRSSRDEPLTVILLRFLMKFEFYQQIFEKYTNVKFCENCSVGSESRVDGQTDMTKRKVVCGNFVNTPKKTD